MLVWPFPALLTWLLAWGAFIALQALGLPAPWSFGLAQAAATAAAMRGRTPWRQGFIALGFPLSLLASGASSLPAWLWLLPLLLLLLLYPLRSWRDAPLFPTPEAALRGLAGRLGLAPDARIVDAGCGLGAGLQALREEFPQARLEGLEWSWPLSLACRWRCPWATVRRADIWRTDWSGFDLVYLFQRPESMARALDKATAEMAPGRFVVSLEFEAAGRQPWARLESVPGKPVWIYRL